VFASVDVAVEDEVVLDDELLLDAFIEERGKIFKRYPPSAS
jgi:hypothetical protein